MLESQREQGGIYYKGARDGKPAYVLGYEKAPPTRLLALNLILSYWIGWISQTHGLSEAMNMILKAYSTGKLDLDGSHSKYYMLSVTGTWDEIS